LIEYVKICRENKIDQLILHDGTTIKMSPLAYYDDANVQKPLAQGDFPTYNESAGEIIDEDILYASSRL